MIFDVKSSEVLPAELARVGLTPIMWKTGHSLIKKKMLEEGAILAGNEQQMSYSEFVQQVKNDKDRKSVV